MLKLVIDEPQDMEKVMGIKTKHLGLLNGGLFELSSMCGPLYWWNIIEVYCTKGQVTGCSAVLQHPNPFMNLDLCVYVVIRC